MLTNSMYDEVDMIKATHIWDQYLQSERDRDSAANTRFWKNTQMQKLYVLQMYFDKYMQIQITIEYFWLNMRKN